MLAQELTEQADAARARAETMTTELRDSENRFRTLFDLCPVAVYSCDAAGTIINFNPEAAKMWGREPARGSLEERFCGSFELRLTDGTPISHDQCPMAEVLDGRLSQVVDREIIIGRPDGTRSSVRRQHPRPLRRTHQR